MGSIEEADLAVECYMTNPPRPGGVLIKVDGRTIAFVTIEAFKKTARRLQELEDAANLK